MRKRAKSSRWLNWLVYSLPRLEKSARRTPRSVRLEQLEARIVLTTPVAVDDSYFQDYGNVAQTNGHLLVLSNDTPAVSRPSFTIAAVNGIAAGAGEQQYQLPEVLPGGTSYGTLTLSFDHTFFTFTPAVGFTGLQTFTYEASDGGTPSNYATVTINVHPVTYADVPSFINDGSSLHLDDLNGVVSGTSAPAPVAYYWYADTSGTDPFLGGYDPVASGATLLNPYTPATSSYDLTPDQLSALSGLPYPVVVTLKVVDHNGNSAIAPRYIDVGDVPPNITSFTITPVGCGGTTVAMTATFVDPNLNDPSPNVSVTWDIFDFIPNDPDGITETFGDPYYGDDGSHGIITNNHDGTFTLTDTHTYEVGGYKLPSLSVNFGEAESTVTNGVINPNTIDLGGGNLLHLSDLGTVFLNVTGGSMGGSLTAAIDGAPTTSPEGTPITLTGDVFDPCPGDATYAWSVTKDGQPYSTTGNNAANFSFTPDDNGTYVVSFSATDDDDGTVPATPATIIVTNVAPIVMPISGPTQGVTEQTLSFGSSFTDPGTADTHTTGWEVTNSANTVVASGMGLSFGFTPAVSDTYTVTFTVADDDDGSSEVSHSVIVTTTLTQAGTVYVGGSSGADSITVNPNSIPAGTNTVIVYGGPGDDNLQISGSINATVWLIGGPGNDRLKGGGGNDIIIGGDGDDLLMGGGGRDIIIGGNGADRIIGDAGDDILIGGITAYDANDAALNAIMAEWSSTRTFNQRVANISNGTISGAGAPTGNGLNGTYYVIEDHTVVDDNAADILTGSAGMDWFLFNADGENGTKKDKVTDLSATEFASDLDWIAFLP